MSGGHFHVHGPHDHAVEHASQGHAEHGGEGLATRVAVMTAILSTVGAIMSYLGGHTQNESMMYKNEAVLAKTAASNQWNYYQAKSSKQNLAELGLSLAPPDKREFYEKEIARYKQEKDEIKKEADKLEAQAAEFNKKSSDAMHPHHNLALGTTLIQIAISLAAITLLTKLRWLYWGSGIAATIGVAFGALAYFH